MKQPQSEKMMKKRGKKLHITIDNLPTGLENGKIMNGSGGGGSSSCGVNSKNITSLIGISTRVFRKRRNFSIILFVGLSALLCALYYTTYYPGAVWTLRFGVTSFTFSHSGTATPGFDEGQQKSESFALMGSAGRTDLNHVPDGNTGKKRKKNSSPSAFDGRSNSNNNDGSGRSSSNTGNTQVISLSISHLSSVNNQGATAVGDDDDEEGKTGRSRSKPRKSVSNTQGEAGEEGENAVEISTPKTWNWKYWASLQYWRVNITGGSAEQNNDVDGFPHSLSGKLAGGSSSVRDLLATKSRDGGAVKINLSVTKPGQPSVGKVAETTRKNSGGGERLSCNFPRLNPFDPSITDFIKSPPAIDCRKSYPLVFRTNFRNKLIQWGHPFPASIIVDRESGGGVDNSNKVGNYNCCYKTITRGNGSDHNVIFSKRCYPIMKTETEIPAVHEFISVRCRNLGGSNQANQQRNNNKVSSFLSNKETSSTNGGNSGSSSTNNSNDNRIYSVNNNISNNGTAGGKVYKDILAFVPLKPLVEDRIRKYEESRRKFRYSHKIKNNNHESKRMDYPPENRSSGEKVGEKQAYQWHEVPHNQHPEPKQQQGESINLSEENRDPPDVYQTSPPETLIANEDRLSIVVLGLDAQSHMNFIRQMPQTYNFLTKNLSSVGMYGYTKVGDNTFPNVVTLLSGLSVEELILRCWPTKDSYFDGCPFIWKRFAESGYRTSLAEDSVWMGTFNYEKKGFLQPPTDYYLHPLSLLMAKKIGHETWANAKLCYGPRLAFEVLLDYIVKTAVTFRDSLYFQFVWANSLFHDYLNNPRLGDELLCMTLEYLRNNGYLNNTAFILLSDHGIRWGSIRSTYQGKIEERMPLAYFYFPAWFRRKYPKALKNLGKNVLRLTTPFDVHETLRDILRLSKGEKVSFDRWSEDNDDSYNKGGGGSKSGIERAGGRGRSDSESDERPPRGISLFRLVPLKRTCKMAGIEEHWCVCHSMQSVPINSTLVQSGAQFIVHVINGLVKKHSGFCAKLSLFKINEAKRKIDGDIDRGLNIDFLVPTISTSGGGGSSNNDEVVLSTGAPPFHPGNTAAGDDDHAGGSIYRASDKILGSGNKRDILEKSRGDSVQKYKKADKLPNQQDKNGSSVTFPFSSSMLNREEAGSLSTSSDIKKMIQLQIVIVTIPGNAVFEATIYGEAEIVNRPINDQDIDQDAGQRSNHHWKLSGDISRLNLYGAQSACVTDYSVQKYCYCHDLDVE